MLDPSDKDRYERLSDTDLLCLAGTMMYGGLTSYRNDEGTDFNNDYYRFWEHHSFIQGLAEDRNLRVNIGDCPSGLRGASFTEILATLVNRASSSRIIVLDRPLMSYYTRATGSGMAKVHFLCGTCEGAHLIRILREFGIAYTFLDIPVEHWESWKGRPEYGGD